MQAESEMSPAAQPKDIGIIVAATTKACLMLFTEGYQKARYQMINNSHPSKRSHGIGVVTRLVKRKTNKAPRSLPKLDPPTITCAHAEFPMYRCAIMGATLFSR